MNYTERNKLLDKISVIGLMAVFVELFLYAVDYCYTKRFDTVTHMPTAMHICGLIFLAISIVLFVYTFKKEKKNFKIYAIEFLVLALLCPFITYWYYCAYYGLSTSWIHSVNHQVLWIIVLAYYVIRIIYSIVDAYLNSISRKLKKKKAL